MTIVLVSASGAGKTAVGAELADLLGKSFVGIDTRVEEMVGRPVTEIFADSDEARFRTLRRSITLELLETEEIVSLGGGTIMGLRICKAPVGRDIIWLKVSIRQASRHVGFNTVRPLSLGNIQGRLIELFRERAPIYEAVSTTHVNTNRSNPKRITAEFAETRR